MWEPDNKIKSLLHDPVVILYNNLIESTQGGIKLPEYSEIYLRFAVKEFYNDEYYQLMRMFRQILVLYYCEMFASIKSVHHIMEPCFTADEIDAIFLMRYDILKEWQDYVDLCFIKQSKAIELISIEPATTAEVEEEVNKWMQST